MTTPFKFEFELQAFEKASAPVGKRRRIGGWVSTDDLDKQGEILIQKGLDFAPFMNEGFFNDNHLKQTGKAVGYPEIAELRERPDGSQGWYVEGYLLEGHPPADDIWTFATALERAGSPRTLGYSVEGSILERDAIDPLTVRKAVVREVAITRCPVNTKTQLNILAKSLSAGSAVSSPGTSAGEGFPLRTESLESKPTPAIDDEEELRKKKKKSMSKGQAIDLLLERSPQITATTAARIVEYALRLQAA